MFSHDTNFFTSPRYDEHFNNIQKTEFEMHLASIILKSNTSSLNNVLNRMLQKTFTLLEPFLLKVIQQESPSPLSESILEKFWIDMGTNSHELGKIDIALPRDLINRRTVFSSWILYKLSNPQNTNTIVKIRLLLTAERIFFTKLTPDQFITQKSKRISIESKIPEMFFSKENRGRCYRYPTPTSDQQFDQIANNRYEYLKKSTCLFGFIPKRTHNYPKLKSSHLPAHQRGIDRHRAIPSNLHFHDHARFCLDMPLACSISKSIKNGLQYALLIMELSEEDYRYFFLAHMAYLIIAGHHTLYECAYIANLACLPYQEGNCASLLPQPFIDENIESLKQLKSQFPDLLKMGFPRP